MTSSRNLRQSCSWAHRCGARLERRPAAVGRRSHWCAANCRGFAASASSVAPPASFFWGFAGLALYSGRRAALPGVALNGEAQGSVAGWQDHQAAPAGCYGNRLDSGDRFEGIVEATSQGSFVSGNSLERRRARQSTRSQPSAARISPKCQRLLRSSIQGSDRAFGGSRNGGPRE